MKSHTAAAFLLSASSMSICAAAHAEGFTEDEAQSAQTADGSGAQAQSADASAQSSDPAEIIVTAQRRPERLQDVPVSVTALSADILENRNLKDLQQISLAAPSLQLGQENNYSIRGVGTLAFQQTVDPAVAISLDEVSLARNYLSESVFNDIAQVEVLSGPQGVLFGRNASGGLLNITTVTPQLGKFSGDGEIEYNLRDTTPGNGQGVTARANLNIPIGENSALRLNGVYEFQEPVTRGTAVGGARDDANRKAYEFRAKYLLEATDALSIYLIGNYAKRTGTAGLYDRTFRTLAPGSTNAGALAGDGFTAGPNLLEYRHEGDNFRDLENYGAQAKIAYTLPNEWQIINVAAYKGYKLDTAFDQDFTSGNGDSLSAQKSNFGQFSNELRVALPAEGRISGQFGLFYLTFRERFASQNAGDAFLPGFLLPSFPFCVGVVAVPGAPPPACSTSNNSFIGSDQRYRFNSETYAGFGQLTFDLGSGLSAIAGGRWTHDKVSISTTQNLLNYFIRFGGPRGTYADNEANSNFSYRLGLQYKPTRDLMFYGTYATGYKGPGLNNGAATATSRLAVDPETSRNIELGAKTSWLNRRLTANVALFRTSYRDYQAASFDPQSTSFTIRNAAGLVSKGAEISVGLRPAKGLSFNAAATFLDSKFTDFAGAQCYAQQPDCGPGGTFNAGGLRTPLAAKFTSSLGVAYETPLSEKANFFVGGDWYHRSAINFGVANPLSALDAIDLFGARLGVDFSPGIKFSVFCKNCTDKRVPTFIYSDPGDFSQGLNSSVQTFGFNSVRTLGASLGFEF